MFSGIVESIGTIIKMTIENSCYVLTIKPHLTFNDLTIGDSIAINGVCLTITHFTAQNFTVTIVPETLKRSNLSKLQLNDNVNIERSLQLNARIGGHMVQGHVDDQGHILELTTIDRGAQLIKISYPPHLANYLVTKGYVTLDGMSITLIEVTENWFTITLIPHTQAVTIANHYQVGTSINIEVDILGKYIEKLARSTHASNATTC